MSAWVLAEVLPHAGAMILLDHVETLEAERIVCTMTVRENLFTEANGALPSWVSVELMGQAIAAWAGCHAQREQRPVQVGFLLGTRQYTCNVDAFAAGATLRIEAIRSFHDQHGMGVFACRIDGDGVLAEARLNVFSPPDAAAFFQKHAEGTSHE